MNAATLERFCAEYAAHRASEGRAHRGSELRSLPYFAAGPLARQWAVRARSFETLVQRVVTRLEGKRPLRILDLGAGNGWLSYRLALRGHHCTAIDIRNDAVDGLGAAQALRKIAPFDCLVASFDQLPLPTGEADLAVFNASLHYAAELKDTLGEAQRCTRAGGVIAIVDSPFYHRRSDGEAMVREKLAGGGLPEFECIEFLTVEHLAQASPLAWIRHRVRYPLWYELRPLVARLAGARRPSRFDVWCATVP